MGRADGTDPALAETPVPLEGDGRELLGVIIDGRYRLDATLGRGGMGLVYRAAHVGLRRQVAVKILHPSLAASSDVRNRFEREALAVGKIDHPNCVSVYDVGRLPDGSLYLAMELLEGRALADVLEQEGQLAPGRALHILAGILRGLSHIHSAKLIHRDIKPENIFLIRQGQDEDFAKILDFGIAKPMEASDLDDGVKLTQAGMAFGTPIYMAPEQALGNPMDGRADLYAAAVLAYEMLCGQPPFYSDDKLEVMSMHTARPVPPMRQRLVRGGRPVPSSIERLVVRGLTKKPGDRYASADEFLAEVEHALRTPDGGVTDVVFERVGDTGSQPLVNEDGEVHITGATDLAPPASALIEDAINDALGLAPRPGPSAGWAPGQREETVVDANPAGDAMWARPASDEAEAARRVARRRLPGVATETDEVAELRAADGRHAAEAAASRSPDAPRRADGSGARAAGAGDSAARRPVDGAGDSAAWRAEGPLAADGPRTAEAGAPAWRRGPAGGVGLGLPYTGPSGEPIFGLTPEQRLAGAIHDASDGGVANALEPEPRAPTIIPHLRKRFGLYVVIALCAIAIGVVGAVITANANRGEVGELDPSTPAGAANEALEHGDPARALQLLEANKAALLGDPMAQLVLGHVRAARNESGLALEAYERALKLRPELEHDDKLRAALRTMAGGTQDYAVVAQAFDLWVGRTADPEARKLLLLGAVHDDLARRRAVRPVIERQKLGGQVDWLKAYSLDLEQDTPCEARKQAVANLRALGDKRAVEPLERAIIKVGKSGAYRGKKINGCLIDDATAAIGYLRGLSDK
jgi:serine/threonine protein kinase